MSKLEKLESMSKRYTDVHLKMTSGDVVHAAVSRIIFTGEAIELWKAGVEIARHPIAEVASIDFGRQPVVDPSYSVGDIRGEHRNAYSRWTPEEDALLVEMTKNAASIADIAAVFGRQRSAIRSRLSKLSPDRANATVRIISGDEDS